MKDKPPGFSICHDASEPLRPLHQLGYTCAICSRPLQLSPIAVTAAKINIVPLCAVCGTLVSAKLAQKQVPQTFIRSSEVAEKIMTDKKRGEN
jgi:ribosome-binding protein aMBF1 (putative translation factor)